MRGVLEIIDFYLNQLLNSKPSPQSKILLAKLVDILKELKYPNVELVDIISIRLMLDYLLSDEESIKKYEAMIKKAFHILSDILSDKLYIKIEPEIILLEDDFYKNVCLDERQFENRLIEELKSLLLNH